MRLGGNSTNSAAHRGVWFSRIWWTRPSRGESPVRYVGHHGIMSDDDCRVSTALPLIASNTTIRCARRAPVARRTTGFRTFGYGARSHARCSSPDSERKVIHSGSEIDHFKAVSRHRVVGNLSNQGHILTGSKAGNEIIELEDKAYRSRRNRVIDPSAVVRSRSCKSVPGGRNRAAGC
jgi:hypothetical protein